MARISKSGITNGGTIDSTHLTRIIEALDGTGSADIYATGSFTGSFIGDGSQLTGIAGGGGTPGGSDTEIQYNNSNTFDGVPSLTYDGSILRATGSFSGSFVGTATTASYVNALSQNVTITGSFNTSGSRVRNYRTVTLTDADYSLVPSQNIQANDDIILFIDNTTSAPSVGEANFNITNFLNSNAGRCVELVKVKDGFLGGIYIASISMAGVSTHLNDTSYPNSKLICTSIGDSITLMSMGLANTGSAWGNGF
jgi:hypothetical protein